ncbi:MAG: hypothetical protein QFX35_03760 [Candidatus Verstraetearchaeota archaeon]|nr:hypothetical protein [Candidatus Verstraetearchaeota archaeon]
MWLVILSLAAAITTAVWYSKADDDKYMLWFLGLMLWGASIMVFVDHAIPFILEGGGEFFEMTTEATVLGVVMLTVALIVWEVVLILKDPKGVLFKRKQTNTSETKH